jgi:hypothetical protein
MSQTATSPNGAPLHLDRNKSIIWARYLIDSPDWLVFATRVTRAGATPSATITSTATAQPTPVKLLSLSLMTPSGKVVYEAMVKPEETLSANLTGEHGLDYSVVYNAQPFADILLKLRQLIGSKQILVWDLEAQQNIFDQLCVHSAQPMLPFAGYSLRSEYARFVGEIDGATGSYKNQTLTTDGISATAEGRAILNTLTTMASTSQVRDTAPTGHQGWTAELYKPKVNAKEKIKDFLGL